MQEKWTKILENLENLLEPGIFRIWLAPLSAEISSNFIRLFAPNAYVADWVNKRLKKTICQVTAAELGIKEEELNFDICLKSNLDKSGSNKAKPVSQLNLPIKDAGLANAIVNKQSLKRWHYSFDDLVTGPSNNLAVAAAKDLVSNGQVRTLFVNSSAGLGKTHLSQAAGCALNARGPVKIAYLTAEQFASRFVTAMRNKELEELKQYLCNVDALLLEDIHFLQRKKAMQEMILSVVKRLEDKGARVIFTSSFAPRELQDMDDQLVSHFCSGILAKMDKPNVAMRREILTRKANLWQVKLPDDVCDLLSTRLSSDVRQLESCLKNLIFKARILNSGINIDMAIETANQYAGAETGLSLHSIIKMVCESYGVTEHQLKSKSRKQEYVHGRNTAFYLARKHTEMTLEEIGCIFNRRYSTVMRGITQVEEEMARESNQGRQFARAVAQIEHRFGITN